MDYTANQIIAQMESTHMTKTRRNTYIALEELDFTWDRKEILEVKKLWSQGMHLADMAQSIDRDIDEVFILLLDLARKNCLPKRQGGVYGCLLKQSTL